MGGCLQRSKLRADRRRASHRFQSDRCGRVTVLPDGSGFFVAEINTDPAPFELEAAAVTRPAGWWRRLWWRITGRLA